MSKILSFMRRLSVLGLLVFATKIYASPEFFVYSEATLSVVEVISKNCSHENQTDKDRQGSGFFWRSNSSVITALHVISGCQSIRIRYQNQGEFAVSNVRFDISHDIAELQLETSPQPAAISQENNTVFAGEQIYAVGYPFSINSPDSFPLVVTPATIGKGKLKYLLPPTMHPVAKSIGFDLNTQIIRTQPGVHPGLSGAPVVNKNCELLGIGHGRLSSTSGAIGWITRVEELGSLDSKPWCQIQDIPNISALFLSGENLNSAAKSEHTDAVQFGELKLRYRWRRDYSEIVKTHNNPKGLEEITKGASEIGLDLDNLAFNVWYEETTGAYITIPADWKLSFQNGKCIASDPNDKGGSVEIIGRAMASNDDARNQLDVIQKQEEDTKPRGFTATVKLRLFNNDNEILTNGAIINRRTYRGVLRNSDEAVSVAQTGFVRNSAVLIVLGRTSMTVNEAMSYGLCDVRGWEGEDCARVKKASVETAKSLLSAALSTVPES